MALSCTLRPGDLDLVTSTFHEAGYETVSRRLPSVGASNPNLATQDNDARFIVENILDPLLEAKEDIILVSHSYGGLPAAVAAHGVSKSDRSTAGLPGGIVGLINTATFLAPPNKSLADFVKGPVPWWQVGVSSRFYRHIYNACRSTLDSDAHRFHLQAT